MPINWGVVADALLVEGEVVVHGGVEALFLAVHVPGVVVHDEIGWLNHVALVLVALVVVSLAGVARLDLAVDGLEEVAHVPGVVSLAEIVPFIFLFFFFLLCF